MKLVLCYGDPSNMFDIQALAHKLDVPWFSSALDLPEDATHVLWVSTHGFALGKVGNKMPTATSVDFLNPTLLYRLRTSGKRQGLGKAVGLDKVAAPTVLDATAGLGRDALVLAYLGCEVLMLEKSALIHILLEDGLNRAKAAGSVLLNKAPLRMHLLQCDALQRFAEIQQGTATRPDVIYLDPMFPTRQKTAMVKKDLALLQEILGVEENFANLLQAARSCAIHRVVVKRPGNSLSKSLPVPTFVVPCKSAHFEVYVNSSFSSSRL